MKSFYRLQGFSLIELMIVIGIISILASIAIPSYRQYTARARFSEVMTQTEPFKIAIALALQEGVPLEEISLGTHGIPSAPLANKNLASIAIENGAIIATGTALTKNATYVLTPNEDGSHWDISGSCLASGWCSD